MYTYLLSHLDDVGILFCFYKYMYINAWLQNIVRNLVLNKLSLYNKFVCMKAKS